MPKYQYDNVPSKDAINYLKNKGIKPSYNYKEVWQNEHAFAFTVAKATEIDILNDIREAVETALAEGKTLEQFKKELTPLLVEKGWWGEKEVINPKTGVKELVQLGCPRRLKTIYNTNLKTARMAGKWERAQRTKKELPYFMYTLGPSKEHRKEHAKWKGLILPIDDPFWNKHMPPNGWGCKCSVRQITETEAKRRGGVSKAPVTPEYEFYNEETGTTTLVPIGVDPAFANNPAKARAENLSNFLAGKLEALPQNLARVAVKDTVSSFAFEGIYKGEAPKGSYVPVGVLPVERMKQLGVDTRVVRFSDYTANKGAAKHGDVRQEDYEKVQWLMEHGEAIEDRENHIIFVGKDKKGDGWKFTVKKTHDNKELYLQTFHRLRKEQLDQILKRRK